jgi:hypothetical protein
MRNFFLVLVFLLAGQAFAGQKGPFPLGPDASMTPGSLCDRPSEYRYPEKIAYCNRNVDSETKRQIIRDYNEKLGYQIKDADRAKYKIDHFYPLCMGGSNHVDNLWPQHESVYAQTDMIEQVGCEKMAAGRLQQRLAIDLVRQAKLDLSKAKAVLARIRAL